MYCIILCGGSGTRLWPLSRRNLAKQFLRLYSDNSLLQETYFRARKLMANDHIFFVTNKNGFEKVFQQIQEVEKNFDPSQIIIEPISLNTAPALACAVKYLLSQKKISLDEKILSLHADHYIRDTEKYIALLQNALESVGDNIGTIGITPTKPETGYGYIHKGRQAAGNEFFEVLEFKEKPDRETAERYLRSGEYVWNSGMYLFSVKTFLCEMETYAPNIFSLMNEKWEVFLGNFSTLPSISIDNAISEKSKRVVVFAGDFGWSDIGSFDSLADIIGHNPTARHIGIDSKNVFTYSSENRLIATIGVEDLIVVETKGSILICKRGRAEDVKKVVEKLKESEPEEL